MVNVRLSETSLRNLQRGVKYAKDRSSFRHRARRAKNKLTAAEKSLLRQRRRKNAADLKAALSEAQALIWGFARQMSEQFKNHKPGYFYQLIMQQSRRPAATRKVSKWNAFLSQELKRRNNELPEGVDRKRVSDALIKDIAEEWKGMSEQERDVATSDTVQELYEQRANRAYGRHSVPARAFGDARTTLAHIESELRALHSRTNLELFLVATRSTQTSYMQPYTFVTSHALEDFVLSTTKCTIPEYAIQMEGYFIGQGSNVRNAAQSSKAHLLRLKHEAAVLIDQKLRKRGRIPQMKYVNFHKITEDYGVVLEGWPLKGKFCPPGELSSRPHLEILINAWKSGAARFRCLTDDEWDEWRVQRGQQQMQHISNADAEQPNSTSMPQSPSDPLAPSSTTSPALPSTTPS
ncbi:hypothetical protein C8Q73DRAFT_659173, partial [Cubamyces lactineus]